MRHSESRLTEENYTDKQHLPMAAAVSKVETDFLGERLAHRLALDLVPDGQNASLAVATRQNLTASESFGNQHLRPAFSPDVAPCPKVAVAASLGFEPTGIQRALVASAIPVPLSSHEFVVGEGVLSVKK
jgi:hypothetical protein